jgi:transposase
MVAVVLSEGESAEALRRAAARARDASQARRLLALAAIRDGASREAAARAGGMTRQTLRDWVHAYNELGIEGLVNTLPPGRAPKLNAAQKAELKALVENGPDPQVDGVVRWRRVDLKRIAAERFSVSVDEDTIGRVLKELGFAHISARPLAPGQQAEAIATFKKNSMPVSTRR